jgi:hypothetical protein
MGAMLDRFSVCGASFKTLNTHSRNGRLLTGNGSEITLFLQIRFRRVSPEMATMRSLIN